MPRCQRCQQPGSGDNIESTLLEKLLPGGYDHLVCTYEETGEGQFKAKIKLRITSEDEVHKWLKDFQTSSKLTWRKGKTYPYKPGRRNVYKVDLRCQHKTQPSKTGVKSTKNTSCCATMCLVLKRKLYSKDRKSRSSDPHIKDGYLFNINLRHEHNHRLWDTEALRRRDVSPETIEKLMVLFETGHSPSSALATIKYELQDQEGDNYIDAAADRAICPDLHFCYSLYYKMFHKSVRSNASGGLSSAQEGYSQEESMDEVPSPGSLNTSGTSSVEDLEAGLQLFCSSITEKLEDNPQTFTAPIRAFLETYSKMSDSSIISALHCFGKVPQVKAKYLQSSKMIGVEPPTIAKRKAALGGRHALLIPGRPPKCSRKEQQHSKENCKKSAPHSLAKCVEDNTCLGGHH